MVKSPQNLNASAFSHIDSARLKNNLSPKDVIDAMKKKNELNQPL